MCTYLTLLLDSAHQILHRGEEPDPDNSADGSHRQSCSEGEVGSLRGVHKKVPQPFLPLQGRLKTPSFQLQEPTGSQPNLLTP